MAKIKSIVCERPGCNRQLTAKQIQPHKKARYCSQLCHLKVLAAKARANPKTRPPRECKQCGKALTQAQLMAQVRQHHYCSSTCWYVAIRKPRRKCPVCGNLCARSCQFCSRECSGQMQRRRNICRVCGKTCPRRRAWYCSNECWIKGISGDNSHFYVHGQGEAPYPLGWKKISYQIRRRDGYKCQWCGTSVRKVGGWAAHHIDYNVPNCSLWNLITLCDSCHARTNPKAHRPYWERTFHRMMIESGLYSDIQSAAEMIAPA